MATLEAEAERQRGEAAVRVAGLEGEKRAVEAAAAQGAAEAAAMWAEEKKALLGGFAVEREGTRLEVDALRQQLEAMQCLAAEADERAEATREDLEVKLRTAEARLVGAHARWKEERAALEAEHARDRGLWEEKGAALQRSLAAATAGTADLQRLHEQEVASLGRARAAAEAEAARWRAACEEGRERALEEGRRAGAADARARAAALAASLGLPWGDDDGDAVEEEEWAGALERAVRLRLGEAAAEARGLAEERAGIVNAVARFARQLHGRVVALDPDAAAAASALGGDDEEEAWGVEASLRIATTSLDWLLERARAESEAAWASRLEEQETQAHEALEALLAGVRAEGEEEVARARRAAAEEEAGTWRRRLEEEATAREEVEAEAARLRALLEEQAGEFRAELEGLAEEQEARVEAAVAAEQRAWAGRWEEALQDKARAVAAAKEHAARAAEAAWQERVGAVLGEKERFYQRKVEEAQRAARAAVDEARAQADMDARRRQGDWELEARASVMAEARAAALGEVAEREEAMRGVLAEVQAQVCAATRVVAQTQAEADARVRAAVDGARREAWEQEGRWEREVAGLRRRLLERDAALAAANASVAEAEAARREQERQERESMAMAVAAEEKDVGLQTEEEGQDKASAAAAAAAVEPEETATPTTPTPASTARAPTTATPTDKDRAQQLRAALLAGDAARVRGLLPPPQQAGHDDAALPLLPLPIHMAIQGLAFHGSLPALLATLDVLAPSSPSDLLVADDEQHGDTPLHLALKLPSLPHAAAVAERLLLLASSSAPALLLRKANHAGKTPLHLAVTRAVVSPEGVALLRRLLLALDGDGGKAEEARGNHVGSKAQGGAGSLLNAALLTAAAVAAPGPAAPSLAASAAAATKTPVSRASGGGLARTTASAPASAAVEVLSLLQGAGLAAWDGRWREEGGAGRTQGELLACLAPTVEGGGCGGGDKARLVYDKLVRAALAGGVLVPRLGGKTQQRR